MPEFAAESQTKFYPELKQILAEHFKKSGRSFKNSPWIWLRYAVIFATVLGCSAVLLRSPEHSLLFGLLLSAVQGFACALVGLMPLHDASHFSITKLPWVWTALMHSHDFLNGASSLVWTYQHILGHHPYTNVEGADPDIATTEHDVRRIKKSQPWYSHYLFQHAYAPVLYGLLAWKTRLQDIVILFVSRQNGSIRVNTPTFEQSALFWSGKLFWFAYRVALPTYVLGLSRTLAYLTVADLVVSYWLALTFQVNHVVDEVEWLRAGEDNKIHVDWAEAQLQTTQDCKISLSIVKIFAPKIIQILKIILNVNCFKIFKKNVKKFCQTFRNFC